MSTPITIELRLPASAAETWAAWTVPAVLESWLTQKARVELRVGGAYELFWQPDEPEKNSTLGCKLTAVEPQRRLAFTWRGPVPYAHLMNVGEPPPTHVEVLLESRGEGTVVRLEHAGWGAGKEWDEARAWQARAWAAAFEALPKVLSQAPAK